MQNKQTNQLETVYLKGEIGKCEDLDELKKEIFPKLKSQKEQWARKINEIIEQSGYTKTEFAKQCDVSRVTLTKWCKGSLPKNRETFLTIGMAANYDIDQMNQLLQRYGQYPGLYSKSLEDCVCIFVLNHDFGNQTLSKYYYILNKIKETIIRDDSAESENISTVKFDEKLSDVKDEDELEKFITENIAIFSYSYHKFYAYVKNSINANYPERATSISNLADAQEWSSSLRQCVSAIRQNKWYPTRNKIISLGLHLSMDHDEIDDMLTLAHMEPLCGKNIFESVIMFILDNASLNNVMDREQDKYDSDALCKYARTVLEEFDLPEVESFLSELPEVDDER